MTYKRADRPGWPRLRGQRFICQRIAHGQVNGYATLLHMLEVTEPLWVTHKEQRIRIADAGYSWLQIFPEGGNYTHTTMFDGEGQPVQEYIDLVAEQGVGEDGIPWYDDLYLDIAWIPEGDPLLLDQDELEAAHAIGAITEAQYELARGETARLLVALTLGEYTLPEVAHACYPALRAALDVAAMAAEAPVAEDVETTPPDATTIDRVGADDGETSVTPDAPETSSAMAPSDHEEQSEQSDQAEQPEQPEQALEEGEQHA